MFRILLCCQRPVLSARSVWTCGLYYGHIFLCYLFLSYSLLSELRAGDTVGLVPSKKELAVSVILVININRLISYLCPDSLVELGCCPLPDSLMQRRHLSFAHRYPGIHSQTVLLLAVQFTFTRILSGAEERRAARHRQNTSSYIHYTAPVLKLTLDMISTEPNASLLNLWLFKLKIIHRLSWWQNPNTQFCEDKISNFWASLLNMEACFENKN